MQVALAHLFFNVTGICIFYPIPRLRLPVFAARNLGQLAGMWRGFPVLYIGVMFFVFPILLLGLSSLYDQGTVGFTVLASVLTIVMLSVVLYTAYWFRFNDGRAQCMAWFERREKRRSVMADLPDDMEFLMTKVMALIEHTDLPDDDDEQGDDEEEIGNSYVQVATAT